MLNGNAVSTNNRWWRLIVIAIATTALLAAGTYIVLRLRATYSNQAELQRIKADNEDFKRRGAGAVRILSQRIEALESSVYGELEPAVKNGLPPRVIIRRDGWSENRDKELRDRIRRLELWRLQQEYWKEEARK